MASWRDRAKDRPQTAEGRRDNLQDRLSNRGDRQDNRQDARGDRQDDRQNWRDNNREDWQNHFDDRYPHHGDWYNGHWNGHWGAGGWWDHMWSEHPVAAAYGLTWWGVNRATWWSGYWPYYNPYAVDVPTTVYNYSTPFVEYVPVAMDSAPAAPATPAVPAAEALPPGVTQEGITAFDAAREAFSQGRYGHALESVNQAVKQMPNDAVVHEFRALVLFAMGNYKEAAAALYPVLSAGPGWDWTTMSSLYSNPSDYEKQLRDLESYSGRNPKAADGHFLLGYHYLTCGHPDQAAEEYREVLKVNPEDRLTSNLLAMVTPAKEAPAQDKSATPAAGQPEPAKEPVKTIPTADVVGTWTAAGAKGARFTMTLTSDGKFTWAYTRGSQREEAKGVFAIEQNVLALEPNGTSAMLAEITLAGDGKMKFALIGAPKDDPGLEFVRNK